MTDLNIKFRINSSPLNLPKLWILKFSSESLQSSKIQILLIYWCENLWMMLHLFGVFLSSIETFKNVPINQLLLLFIHLRELIACFYWCLVNPFSKQNHHKSRPDKKLRNRLMQWLLTGLILFLLSVEILLPEVIVRLLPKFLFFCSNFVFLFLRHVIFILFIFYCKLFIFELLERVVSCCYLYKKIFALFCCLLF